jgi:hypothetical protein
MTLLLIELPGTDVAAVGPTPLSRGPKTERAVTRCAAKVARRTSEIVRRHGQTNLERKLP